MKLDIRPHPTEPEKALISIESSPIKIIDIQGQKVTIEWEGMRWTTKILERFDFIPEQEDVKNAFLSRINQLLSTAGEDWVVCPICLNSFMRDDPKRKYCSNKCKQKAYRERYEPNN